jgi:hypothetical protein
MMEALAPPTIAAPPTGDTITAWLAWLVANQALIIAALTAIAPILVACASLYLKLKASRMDVRDGDTALEVLGYAIETASPAEIPEEELIKLNLSQLQARALKRLMADGLRRNLKDRVKGSVRASPEAVRVKIKNMVDRIDPKKGGKK